MLGLAVEVVELVVVLLDELVLALALFGLLELEAVDLFVFLPQSSIFSHHWHHHSVPTRMRSFGCQQYAMSSSVLR